MAGMIKDKAGKGKFADACKDDTAKFCPDNHPGDKKWWPCLKKHADELSDSCKSAFFARPDKKKEAKDDSAKPAEPDQQSGDDKSLDDNQ